MQDALGASMALGDLDGNGVDDILVGAPEATGPAGERAGEVTVYTR